MVSSIMWHQFLRQYLNQEHVIQKLADSKIIRSTARFFVSTIYGMRMSIFRDFWKRIEFFSKKFGEEFKKSLTQKK
uniref:DNA-directed DNA polymerase n=1 Tax=Loa loa TaxID=7209 RepID=A0A1I7VUH9_LOALO